MNQWVRNTREPKLETMGEFQLAVFVRQGPLLCWRVPRPSLGVTLFPFSLYGDFVTNTWTLLSFTDLICEKNFFKKRKWKQNPPFLLKTLILDI